MEIDHRIRGMRGDYCTNRITSLFRRRRRSGEEPGVAGTGVCFALALRARE